MESCLANRCEFCLSIKASRLPCILQIFWLQKFLVALCWQGEELKVLLPKCQRLCKEGSDLANYFTVDDSLVTRLDGGVVCENWDGCIKFPDCLRVEGSACQNHSLPHQPPFQLLQGHCSCLPCHHLQHTPKLRTWISITFTRDIKALLRQAVKAIQWACKGPRPFHGHDFAE